MFDVKRPAAYIRRSSVDADSPGDISREAQRDAIRRLAERDGHAGDLLEYDDWGISADIAKTAKRTAWHRLLSDMEAGKVSAVYAFDVDRLYRDPRDLLKLQDAASRHGVTITTTAGPLAVGEGDDPAAEAFAFMGAVWARMELQRAKKRVRAGLDVRRRRGDRFGHAPFGYRHVREADGRIVRVPDPAAQVEAVLQAYREARSVLGACRLLEARGVPAPKGGARWATSLVTRILEREAPELLPPKSHSGLRTPTNALLAQLLECPYCSNRLTPNAHRGQYYCSNGARDRDRHPRYTVREADLLPWVRAEAARLRVPAERVELRARDATRQDELQARRRRVLDNYEDGLIEKPERDSKLAAIDAELPRLDAAAVDIPAAVDFSWPPSSVNRVLRTMWHHVELDERLLPVRAEWLVPWLREGS